jgi:phage major head subunit gpT-like protein
MGQEFDLVSTDAQRALEEFSEEFSAAYTQGGVDQWAKTNGLYRSSKALKTTYPVPVSAAGYSEFRGDMKYRGLFEKSFDLKPKTWQDGVAELASIIEAPDFTGWNDQPAAMAMAAQSIANEIVAGLLESNPTCWDGVAFFHASHPVNVFDSSFGTFDNDVTGAGTDVTAANLALAMAHFDGLKAPNGKPLGLRMTHVFHPPSQRQAWKNLLENDLLIQAVGSSFGAVNNIYKGSITPVCCYELTDTSKWYPAALNKPGMFPWVVQDQGAPEEIRQDKTSHLYATTLKVGVSYIHRGNGGLALPACVARWAGTAP